MWGKKCVLKLEFELLHTYYAAVSENMIFSGHTIDTVLYAEVIHDNM